MKRILVFVSLILFFFLIYWFWFRDDEKNHLVFCGVVNDQRGNPIEGVTVESGTSSDVTEKDGKFNFKIKPNKSNRYVLNVSKLGFGLVSKVYASPRCEIVVAMTPATVEEDLNPQEVITIVDNTPEVTEPLGNITIVSNPLDTLPFIIDSNGSLIGFGNPQVLVDTYQAADDTRGRGDRDRDRPTTVEVPPDALEDQRDVNEGSFSSFQDKSSNNVVGSLSTVDIYSPDGMPGDYSVLRADGTIGYMETYGAADVSFYRNGKPLQLRKGMYAKLTIPVDTVMLTYYGNKLPDTMPLLTYDKDTGMWKQDRDKWTGQPVFAQLNKERNSYVGKLSHFSVFNMDEEFADPACFKIVTPASLVQPSPSSIQVYVAGHIKPFYPFGSDCPEGANFAHAIMKMSPFSPMGVRIADNSGQVRSTYVFIAGASSTPANPVCPYTTCTTAASVQIRHDECWMTSPIDGTMQRPIVAVRRGADLNGDHTISNDILADRDGDGLTNVRDNEDSYFTISWVYIRSVTGTTVTNSPMHYQIRYKTFTSGDSFTFSDASDPKVDFDIDAFTQTETFPLTSAAGVSDWKFEKFVPFIASDGPSQTAANVPIAAGTIVVFRVDYSTDGGASFNPGNYHVVNMPSSTTTFFTSFTGANPCYTN